MGVLGVLFPFLIGTTLGSIAGYAGGWVDAALMRLVDVVIAFPFLVATGGFTEALGAAWQDRPYLAKPFTLDSLMRALAELV